MKTKQEGPNPAILPLLRLLEFTSVDPQDEAPLTFALLVWAKLSYEDRISDSLKIERYRNKNINSDTINGVFQGIELGGENGIFQKIALDAKTDLIRETFLAAAIHAERFDRGDQPLFVRAIERINQYVKDGNLLDGSEFYDLVHWSLVAGHSKRYSEFTLPVNLADLMLSLGNIEDGDDICTEWDSSGQLSIRAAAQVGTSVYTVTPNAPLLMKLACILSGVNLSQQEEDPVTGEARVSQGRLHSYDVTLATPQWNKKYDRSVITKDWHDRYPEKAQDGSILAIRQVLSVTKKRAVILLPVNVLFSVSRPFKELRKSLVDEGTIHTIIQLPERTFKHYAGIRTALLVLTPEKRNDHVRFVNIEHDLDDMGGVESLIEGEQDSENARSVSCSEISENNYDLNISRYLMSGDAKKAQETLLKLETIPLEQAVEFIRPVFIKKDEVGEKKAFEVVVADMPDRGYINPPEKEILLSKGFPNDEGNIQFLQPYDVLISVKGSTGKIGIVPESVPPAGEGGWVPGQSTMVLRLLQAGMTKVDPSLLIVIAIFLRSDLGKHQLETLNSGSTIPIIKLADLRQVQIPLIDDREQKKVVESFYQEVEIGKKIEQLKQEQWDVTDNIWSVG